MIMYKKEELEIMFELIDSREKYLFTKILMDKVIKEKYDKIQALDTTSYYHGFQHILNVSNNMLKFIKAMNISPKEADKLLITTLLHDIGRTETGKDHEINGKIFSENYLKKYNLEDYGIDNNDLNDILTAIEFHDHKDKLNEYSEFTLLVSLADKLDITKKRVNLNNKLDPNSPSYKYDLLREIYLDVDNVDIEIDDKNIKVIITGNKNLSKQRLLEIPFVKRMESILNEYSLRKNKGYIIIVESK